MTEEPNRDAPTRDAKEKPPSDASVVPTIEQRVLALETQAYASNVEENRENTSLLSKIEIGEAILIGINALLLFAAVGARCIYYGQLKQMRISTDASAQSAYASCISTKISRATLVELQNGAEDTHDATQAALYQALTTTQSEGPAFDVQASPWRILEDGSLDVAYSFKNIGKSEAMNMKLVLRIEMVPRDGEPQLTYPRGSVSGMSGPLVAAGMQYPLPIGMLNASLRDEAEKEIKPSTQDIADLAAGSKDILTYGVVTYQDSFGIHHWLHFCGAQQNFSNGLLASNGHDTCVKYNRSDKNSVLAITKKKSESKEILPEIVCTSPKTTPDARWWQFWN